MDRGQFFKENVVSQPKRGWHNLSFDNTFSCNAGKLYPTKCLEIFPGDIIHDSSSGFARLMPLVAPVMGKLNLFSYHFIVRNRDIWTQWDKFITNANQKKTWQQNLNFTPPAMPYIDVKEILFGDIYLSNSTPSNLGDFRNVLYVCCATGNGDNGNCIITSSAAVANSVLTNSRLKNRQVYVLIPNKNDTGFNQFYNPFGAGTLLDFLGINIDGFNRDQFKNLNLMVNASLNHQDSGHPLKPWWCESNSDDLDTGLVNSNVTAEWFEEHICLMYGYAGDGTLNGSIQFLTPDGNINDVGSPMTGVVWPSAPFDPSNSSMYDYQITDLSLRAYRFIYDEYFRDENYIEVNLNTDFSRDGNDLDWNNVSWPSIWNYLTYAVKCFEHDLYTTALPQAQKGNPVRFLPDAKVSGIYKSGNPDFTGQGRNILVNGMPDIATEDFGSSTLQNTTSGGHVELYADLSASTIENLRFYNTMQKYLELKARTGSRYYEYMIGQWGYEIEDSKLNRPIYLSGTKTPVQISEVTQTSASDPSTGQPLGDLAGRGVAIGEDDRIDFTSPDYGFLIEICSLVPRTSYGQGIKPMFKRFTYMDYPLPGFANLGEESIKKRELYATLKKSDDDATFGYTCRYYQFKYERDQVHGDMLTSLRHWNFARFFDGVPYNGASFLEVNPSYRQFAVTDKSEDHFLVTMWHDIQINRALPELSIPSL